MTFVHITDTHVGESVFGSGSYTASRFTAMVDDINLECPGASFVVHTGDIGGSTGAADTYREYREIAEGVSLPVHYTLGNHDDRTRFRQIVASGAENSHGAATDPYHWTFDAGGWSFVGVDSCEGFLPDSELGWLADTLIRTSSRPAFLFLHHNPLPVGNGLDRELMLSEPMKLLRLIHAHSQVRGVAFGHMHLTRTLYLEGVHFYCTPSPASALSLEPAEKMLTESDTSYRVFEIQDDGSIETWIRQVEIP